jgi:hypothetical protein
MSLLLPPPLLPMPLLPKLTPPSEFTFSER